MRYVAGESAYGIVSHYHLCQPINNWKETNSELFGCSHIRLHPTLTCHIGKIAALVNIEPNKLLYLGTAFPLYQIVLGHEAQELAEYMIHHDGSKLASISKQAAFSLALDKVLKYCPKCVEESLDSVGRFVWLTEHQLYGVNWCQRHQQILAYIPTGEGGSNRQYVLPEQGNDTHDSLLNNKQQYFSNFIVELYRLLCSFSLLDKLSTYYREWLYIKGYLTKCGHIRAKALGSDLNRFWEALVDVEHAILPLELLNFNYVSQLLHSDVPKHYLKHVMLMAFLTTDPKTFFDIDFRKDSINQAKSGSKTPLNENSILSQLNSGCSMRQVAKSTGYSVGAIKQVALRNGIEIGRRRQRITADMERDIWRKAFVGMHRQIIADFHRISVGAVEQIIQSHTGLSAWRKHLRFQDKLYFHRNTILAFITSNPEYSRNKIKHECISYMWLYKHDNEWLYTYLPKAQSSKYYPSVDWAARDRILAIKIEFMIMPCESISALDRQLGGHHWLTKYASKLPLSMAAAKSKII
jgi:hypothetical protein